jgi:hypothetical protein
MRRFFVLVLAGAVVAIAQFAVSCLAQDVSTGAIHGTGFDPSIRRIAGGSVALVNSATGFRSQRPTNGQGQFAFELLPPGDYTARVTSEGMSPQVSKNLHVDIGGVTHIAFQMTLASARESVTVSAEPKTVETEPRGLSSVIDERAILNLPLTAAASLTSPCSLPESRKTRAASTPHQTATSRSAAFAASRPATWSTAPTTTTPSSPRPPDATAPRISFPTRSSRNSASRQTPFPPNPDAPAAPWLTWSPSQAQTNFTAPDFIICATVRLTPAIRS